MEPIGRSDKGGWSRAGRSSAGGPLANPALRRLLIAGGLPLLLAIGAGFLRAYDPAAVYPLGPCLLHTLTGLDCIGCGMTRALRALLQGDLAAAASYNVYLLIWLPVSAWYLLGTWLKAVAGRPVLPPIRHRRWLVLALLASALLFLVLRNLPVAPFNWLAA
jgi:hypothetical protein